jgi:hypothetical protein
MVAACIKGTEPGVVCEGHFPGSCVLHWDQQDGSVYRPRDGLVLCSDTFMVAPDRKTISFMYSYPNQVTNISLEARIRLIYLDFGGHRYRWDLAKWGRSGGRSSLLSTPSNTSYRHGQGAKSYWAGRSACSTAPNASCASRARSQASMVSLGVPVRTAR